MDFSVQVELLLEVHHKNLTSLVGYCDEGKYIGLIYEFMANGNLEAHLSGLVKLFSLTTIFLFIHVLITYSI